MERVVMGMDPHKRSATIEVMACEETVVGGGRYGTDRDGYAAMLRYARQWPNRAWAIEGCTGIGRHLATRLLPDGEASSTSRRNCPRGHVCSPPGKGARQTPPTRTRLPWPAPR
jgi:hypothetical protein